MSATILAVIILSNTACTRSSQPDSNRNADQWQPIESVPGGFRRYLFGDTRQPGPFKYQLKLPAGSRATAHRHSKDVHVKVLSGSMFIIIGEPLESSRVQAFCGGERLCCSCWTPGMTSGGTRKRSWRPRVLARLRLFTRASEDSVACYCWQCSL